MIFTSIEVTAVWIRCEYLFMLSVRLTSNLDTSHTCGHEFLGEVVTLGSSYNPNVEGRPKLYSSLKVGDKVVSPFTVNCGECQSVDRLLVIPS